MLDSRRASTRVRTAAALASIVGATALVATGVVLAAGSSPTDPSARKPAPKPKPARTLAGTGVIRLGSSFHAASGYERFSYVIVDSGDARAAGTRKLPGTTLVYMNGISLPAGFSTGVPLAQAVANGWVLKDAAGATLTGNQYGHAVADVGSADYQRAFVANVSAFLERTKTDGIFLDDVVAAPAAFTGGPMPAKYPTPEAWEEAMLSFVASVGKGLHARRYQLIVNPSKFIAGDRRSDTAELMTGWWRRLGPHVDGFMSEYWMQNATDITQLRAVGPAWYENWTGWQSLQRVAQGMGKGLFALFYASASDAPTMRYARATFLLDWDGRRGALLFEPTDRPDPFHPMWVKQVGAPVGQKIERAPGVWQRRYQKAVVVVNATAQPVTVRVGELAHRIDATDAVFAAPPRR